MTRPPGGAAGDSALREHLLFLNDATADIGATAGLEQAAARLCAALVPRLADRRVRRLQPRPVWSLPR